MEKGDLKLQKIPAKEEDVKFVKLKKPEDYYPWKDYYKKDDERSREFQEKFKKEKKGLYVTESVGKK